MTRNRLQDRPWDLIIALFYSLGASAGILLVGGGSLWALLLVVFVPGYVVVAAMFPGRGLAAQLRGLHEEGDRLRADSKLSGLSLEAYDGDRSRADAEVNAGRRLQAIRILEESNRKLRASMQGRRQSRSLPPEGRPMQPVGPGRGVKSIDWVERISLSIGLSIAIVSLLSLLLDVTIGVRIESIVVSVLAFTVLVDFLAYERRLKLAAEDRLFPAWTPRWPSWSGYSAVDKGLVVALAASVVLAGATVVYLAISPRPAEHFTQFYLHDANNSINDYPTRLNVSQTGTVVIGVRNNESTRVDYTVDVEREGVIIVRNATSGMNETVVVNTTRLSSFNVTLADGGVWEQPYSFKFDWVGIWVMSFLLFRDNNFASAYSYARLFVNVTR